MGTVYSNPASFGYLPPILQNDFIKAGHNKYAFSKPGKDDDQKVQVTRGNKRKSKTNVRTIDKLGRRVARKAIKQGNEAVAKERPVLAAKSKKYDSKAARHAAIKAAKADPNSARSEAKAKRQKMTVEKPGVQTPASGKGEKGDKGDKGDSGPDYDRNPDAKGPASRSPRDEQGNLKDKESA